MIKVSVIVPVYNVEAYLEKCLESLIAQTLRELEIIVVNDGATDRSQSIIEGFCKKSNRIKAFQKENGGLSDARNFGLVRATGEYLGFVDSDDFVDADMFELLYRKAKEENSDIVECNLHHTYENFEDVEIGREIQDKKEMLMFGRSVVWNKIYRREWLQSTNVIFPKGLIYEDVEFFVKLIPYVRTYSYINAASVHYVQRSSSLNNLSTIKTLHILKILTNICSYYKENDFFDEYKEALEFFYARILLCSSFARICHIENRTERMRALKRNWGMLADTFPDWRQNPVLKRNKSKQAFYMKTVCGITYSLYGNAFPILYFLQDRKVSGTRR